MSTFQLSSEILDSFPHRFSKIYIGFSGGADSVFLCHSLLEHFPKEKIELIHINHNLRADSSDQDQKFCKDFANSLNLKVHFFILPQGWQKLGNLENLARNFRRQIFQRFLRHNIGSLLALGHNQSDNEESRLLNFSRYPSLSQFEGMKTLQNQKNLGFIFRPLLSHSRQEIRQRLKESGIDFRIDDSNFDTSFLRVKLREQVIPFLKSQNTGIVEAFNQISEDSENLKLLYKKNCSDALEEWQKGNKSFSCFIKELNPLISFELISKTLFKLSLKKIPSRDAFNSFLLQLKTGKKSGLANLYGGIILFWEGQDFVFFKEERNMPLSSLENRTVSGEGHLKLPHGLILNFQLNQEIHLSYKIPKQLKKKKAILPRLLASKLPSFFIGEDLIWAPAFGYRKPHEKTKLSIKYPFSFNPYFNPEKWSDLWKNQDPRCKGTFTGHHY